MAIYSAQAAEDLDRTSGLAGSMKSQGSAVSWGAVAAGAAAAASLSLILLILGVGLGLSSVSPWSTEGIEATTFGVSTIVWLTFTQLVASAMGGYLAGRLRSRWIGTTADEVHFRDTAHGFLAWAVASLATASLLSSALGAIVGGGVQASASAISGVASSAGSAVKGIANAGSDASGGAGGSMSYFVDSLFRRDAAAAPASAGVSGSPPEADAIEGGAARTSAEVGRIFLNVGRSQDLPPEDIRYVGQIVSQRTGLSQQEAEKRVSDTYAKAQASVRQAEVTAREAADKARKAGAYGALWLFVSLLIGAFVASLFATFGGRHRDA